MREKRKRKVKKREMEAIRKVTKRPCERGVRSTDRKMKPERKRVRESEADRDTERQRQRGVERKEQQRELERKGCL